MSQDHLRIMMKAMIHTGWLCFTALHKSLCSTHA